jgi:hypothetical protein
MQSALVWYAPITWPRLNRYSRYGDQDARPQHGINSSGKDIRSVETQPVSVQLPIQVFDIEKSSSRDSPRDSRPSARIPQNSQPEIGLMPSNPRKCRYFREYLKSLGRDHGGWLLIEDSNRDVSKSNRSVQIAPRPPSHWALRGSRHDRFSAANRPISTLCPSRRAFTQRFRSKSSFRGNCQRFQRVPRTVFWSGSGHENRACGNRESGSYTLSCRMPCETAAVPNPGTAARSTISGQ